MHWWRVPSSVSKFKTKKFYLQISNVDTIVGVQGLSAMQDMKLNILKWPPGEKCQKKIQQDACPVIELGKFV